MRRVLVALLAALAVSAGRADAVTLRDIIELSKAGLSDQVLLTLIEVDRSVFSIDTATLKRLKDAGVSDAVVIALIRSGRTQPIEPPPVTEPATAPVQPSDPPAPQVVVIDHHDAPAAVAYPVAVPVYVPVPTSSRHFADRTVTTIVPTDQGLVKARVPVPANCIKATPVYWGFDGKLRPGSWEPPPTLLCR